VTAEAQKIKEFYTELFAGSAPLVVFKATPLSKFLLPPEVLFRSPELRVFELSPDCSTSDRRTVKLPSKWAVTAGFVHGAVAKSAEICSPAPID
jgi:hypothetical protein